MPNDKPLSKCPKCGATEYLYFRSKQNSFASLGLGKKPLLMACYAELKTGPDKGYLCGQEFWYDPRSRKITVKE